MTTLPVHYYLDAIGAVFVWVLAWRLSLGQITTVPGLRIGRPKDPETLAGKLGLRMALLPLAVVATDAYTLVEGDAGWWLPAVRIGAVLLIALWIMQTIRAAQE